MFISSVTVRIMIKVMVRVSFNNSHMSHKSHSASYLAMRQIWHDIGTESIYSEPKSVSRSVLALLMSQYINW